MVRRSRLKTEAAARPQDLSRYQGDPDFVLSLARGLRVVECFQGHAEGLSPAEVAQRTGFSRAAVRRLLVTLERLGYAETDGLVYWLRPSVLKLGFSYLSSTSLPAAAQPILERLSEKILESASVTVLDGDEVVYVARASAKRVMSVGLGVGSRLPAYCTAMGRVLLAALPEEEFAAYLKRVELEPMTPKTVSDKKLLAEIVARAREEGYALVDEELELGVRSVAVAVRSRQGSVIGAMNIGVHASRVSASELRREHLPVLRENAILLGNVLP
jgi:IclR family pca regulon transcriptional regulator